MTAKIGSAQARISEQNEVGKSAGDEPQASDTHVQSHETSTDEEPNDGTQEASPYKSSKMSVLMIFICLILTIFLVALDTTILSTAIPKITDDFKSLKDIG